MLLTSKYNIMLQTNVFITSDKIVSAIYSPSNTISHCRRTCLLLATNGFVLERNSFGAGDNTFCAEDSTLCAGDEHFSAVDERVENTCSNFIHMHTQLATTNFQTELMSSSPSKTGAIAGEIQKVCRCTMAFLVALNLSNL